MSRTAKDLIKKVLQETGIIASGEVPSADEYEDCLSALNDLLVEWSADGGGHLVTVTGTAALVSGQAEYTVGTLETDDIATVRPEEIRSVFIRDSNGTDTPLDEWKLARYLIETSNKTQTGTPYKYIWKSTAPSGTIYLYPVPNIPGTLHVEMSGGVEAITSINTDLHSIFSKNYVVALKNILKVEICPLFGREPSVSMILAADRSKSTIETINLRNRLDGVNLATEIPGQGKNCNFLDC